MESYTYPSICKKLKKTLERLQSARNVEKNLRMKYSTKPNIKRPLLPPPPFRRRTTKTTQNNTNIFVIRALVKKKKERVEFKVCQRHTTSIISYPKFFQNAHQILSLVKPLSTNLARARNAISCNEIQLTRVTVTKLAGWA